MLNISLPISYTKEKTPYDLLLDPVLQVKYPSYIPNLSSSDVDPTLNQLNMLHVHEAKIKRQIHFKRMKNQSIDLLHFQ